MNKTDRILDLTSNKTRKFAIILNHDLIELFGLACKKNNTTRTKAVEKFMVKYIDDNGLLDD